MKDSTETIYQCGKEIHWLENIKIEQRFTRLNISWGEKDSYLIKCQERIKIQVH